LCGSVIAQLGGHKLEIVVFTYFIFIQIFLNVALKYYEKREIKEKINGSEKFINKTDKIICHHTIS